MRMQRRSYSSWNVRIGQLFQRSREGLAEHLPPMAQWTSVQSVRATMREHRLPRSVLTAVSTKRPKHLR